MYCTICLAVQQFFFFVLLVLIYRLFHDLSISGNISLINVII